MDGNVIIVGHVYYSKSIIAGRILARNSEAYDILNTDAEKEKGANIECVMSSFFCAKKLLHYWFYWAQKLHMRGAFKWADIAIVVVSIRENQLNVAFDKGQLKTSKAGNSSDFCRNQPENLRKKRGGCFSWFKGCAST